MNRATHLLLLAGLAPALAAQGDAAPERSRPLFLWDPAGPGCILAPPGVDARALRLPPPARPARLDGLFGPGVTEADLVAGAVPDPARPPKLLVGGSGAAFLVVYTDVPGEGFWDPALGAQRRAAFELAAGIAVDLIEDPDLVVSFDASMAFLGTVDAPLASAAPSAVYMDSGLPFGDSWYGEPLFSHLTGSDPDTEQLDVGISYNASWDASMTPWYYGFDSGAAANEYHFVVTTLHEMMHGLDVLDSFGPGGGLMNDDPFAFDNLCVDASGDGLIGLPDVPSTVEGNDVFWSGAAARSCWQNHLLGGGNPPLFAPTPYEAGSSISHWDEASFASPWDLMTPYAELGEPLVLPDAVTRGMLTDLGWSVAFEGVYAAPAAGAAETGKPHQPFGSVAAALAAAAAGGETQLFLASGSHDVSALVVDQPATLNGWPGPAVLE